MSGVISASTVFSGLGAASGVGGLGLNVAGKIKGGQSTAQADAVQAQIVQNNATIANQAAERTIQGGQVNADVAGLKSANTVAGIKSRQAANGINVNTGSAVDVRAGAAEAGEFNRETVMSNAELTAYGYRAKAASDEAEAQLDTLKGGGAIAGSQLAAGGTLLEGVSSLPFGWVKGLGSGSTSGNTTLSGGGTVSGGDTLTVNP